MQAVRFFSSGKPSWKKLQRITEKRRKTLWQLRPIEYTRTYIHTWIENATIFCLFSCAAGHVSAKKAFCVGHGT